MSLRYLSSLAVIKYGIAREDLPQPLYGELDPIEHLNGYFSYRVFGQVNPLCLTIAWAGHWLFPFVGQQTELGAGVKNCLGPGGGELFLFKGWEISVDDFIFDLDRRKVTFFSNISFSRFGDTLRMKMGSELIGDDRIEKVRERVWIGQTIFM